MRRQSLPEKKSVLLRRDGCAADAPIKLLKAGPSPIASPKPGATAFGASTPPGGIKPSPTGGPKGTATPLKGNIRGGFNPANPGAAGLTSHLPGRQSQLAHWGNREAPLRLVLSRRVRLHQNR
jgi:hypothetical protein